jgi:hypothetical protein
MYRSREEHALMVLGFLPTGGEWFVILLIVSFFIFGVPAIFCWLWNWTVPQVFRLPEITYWQSVRLLILAWFIFGGFYHPFYSTTPTTTTVTSAPPVIYIGQPPYELQKR